MSGLSWRSSEGSTWTRKRWSQGIVQLFLQPSPPPPCSVPYNNLKMMRDCFRPTQIALGLTRNSPFKSAVDHKLWQLKEAGIVSPRGVIQYYTVPTLLLKGIVQAAVTYYPAFVHVS